MHPKLFISCTTKLSVVHTHIALSTLSLSCRIKSTVRSVPYVVYLVDVGLLEVWLAGAWPRKLRTPLGFHKILVSLKSIGLSYSTWSLYTALSAQLIPRETDLRNEPKLHIQWVDILSYPYIKFWVCIFKTVGGMTERTGVLANAGTNPAWLIFIGVFKLADFNWYN